MNHEVSALLEHLRAGLRNDESDDAPPESYEPAGLPTVEEALAAGLGGAVEEQVRRLPLDRALRRLLLEIAIRGRRLELLCNPYDFNGDVLVVRSGPVALFRRLLVYLGQAPGDRRLSVVCHIGDVKILEAMPGARINPLVYPRLERFSVKALREVVARAESASWSSMIWLDGESAGRGESVSNVEAALSAWPAVPKFLFNGSACLYQVHSASEDPSAAGFVSRLLDWRHRAGSLPPALE